MFEFHFYFFEVRAYHLLQVVCRIEDAVTHTMDALSPGKFKIEMFPFRQLQVSTLP